MSSLLCLTGDGAAATIFAAALHFVWTGADGVAREESWHVRERHFEFFAARIRKGEEWEHYWPVRPAQARLPPGTGEIVLKQETRKRAPHPPHKPPQADPVAPPAHAHPDH